MAPLSLTLALLAMAVATVAIDVVPLDMAQDSFDDRYEGCGPAMAAALPALNASEIKQNPLWDQAWKNAVEKWQSRGSPLSPLSSPAQAIAVMAYSTRDIYQQFNTAVRTAGRSPREYRDNFQYKTFHFLLTQAVVALRGARCLDVFRGVRSVQFKAQVGDIVRFGQFTSTSLSKEVTKKYGDDTFFEVYTCYGADITAFSQKPSELEVLIPPFETFKVTKYTQEGGRVKIHLRSAGTQSNYKCEWLKGGSVPSTHFHLGGLLLATTALAVATGIL